MDCGGCANTVRAALAALPGVQRVEVFLAGERAEVAFDPARTDLDAIRAAVRRVGYACPLPAAGPGDRTDGDDLARAAVAALFRGRANRAYNVTDDAELKMGDWFDAVADAFKLARPPRVTWDEAEARIAPMMLSFMSESRRLANARMKRELRLRLRYPVPQVLLDEVAPRDLRKQLALPL